MLQEAVLRVKTSTCGDKGETTLMSVVREKQKRDRKGERKERPPMHLRALR